MGQRRYSPTIIESGPRWRSVVRFTPGERAYGTHWIGRWMGPGTVLNAVEWKENLLPLPGVESRQSRRYTG
jgi:hypothetical protein